MVCCVLCLLCLVVVLSIVATVRRKVLPFSVIMTEIVSVSCRISSVISMLSVIKFVIFIVIVLKGSLSPGIVLISSTI